MTGNNTANAGCIGAIGPLRLPLTSSLTRDAGFKRLHLNSKVSFHFGCNVEYRTMVRRDSSPGCAWSLRHNRACVTTTSETTTLVWA